MYNTDIVRWPQEIAGVMRTQCANKKILAQDESFVNALVVTLQTDEDETNRRVAALELGELISVANLPNAVQALLDAVRSDKAWVVRKRATVALGKMHRTSKTEQTRLDAAVVIQEQLEAVDAEARSEAVQAIGRLAGRKLGYQNIQNRILTCLTDADEAVRLSSVVALCPVARQAEVREALRKQAAKDSSHCVRSEIESLLADTMPLVERITANASELFPDPQTIKQHLDPMNGFPSYAYVQGKFAERATKTKDHGGDLGEISYSVFLFDNTEVTEIRIETEAEELYDQVVLLVFGQREQKNNRPGSLSETGPGLTGSGASYLLLQSASGGAMGKLRLPEAWGDPILYEKIVPEDIIPEMLPKLQECIEAQKQADPNSAVAWDQWLDKIRST